MPESTLTVNRWTPTRKAAAILNGVIERFFRGLKQECVRLHHFRVLRGGRTGHHGLD
jgi:hypothetical protein